MTERKRTSYPSMVWNPPIVDCDSELESPSLVCIDEAEGTSSDIEGLQNDDSTTPQTAASTNPEIKSFADDEERPDSFAYTTASSETAGAVDGRVDALRQLSISGNSGRRADLDATPTDDDANMTFDDKKAVWDLPRGVSYVQHDGSKIPGDQPSVTETLGISEGSGEVALSKDTTEDGSPNSTEETTSSPPPEDEEDESQSVQVDPPAVPPVRESSIEVLRLKSHDVAESLEEITAGDNNKLPPSSPEQELGAADESKKEGSPHARLELSPMRQDSDHSRPEGHSTVPRTFSFPQMPQDGVPVDDSSVYGNLRGSFTQGSMLGNPYHGGIGLAPDDTYQRVQIQHQPMPMNGHLNFLAMQHAQAQQQQFLHQAMQQASFGNYGGMPPMHPQSMASVPSGGKRTIKLKLQEEAVPTSQRIHRRSSSFFKRTTRKMFGSDDTIMETDEGGAMTSVNRGTISISWFEGTTSSELQEHVKKSITRKLQLGDHMELDDIRILDMSVDPPEEIVLCPYIPTKSEFLLRYKTKSRNGYVTPPSQYGPPDSPSAAPSPLPTSGLRGSLNPMQLALLQKKLNNAKGAERSSSRAKNAASQNENEKSSVTHKSSEAKSGQETEEDSSETNTLQPEDPIELRLRQITELMLEQQTQQAKHHPIPTKKSEAVFTFANYLTLFILMIAIFAEIGARAPQWLSYVETQLENVHNCSADEDALYECVSKGEFAGLFASVILWLSRSAVTKRFFLFGFDTPKRLRTVVYESGVSSLCWGISYLFIRRGLNADTRPNFVHRYWKDCMYGSLAGFNAAFMKAVLKNLIPQEAVEQALNDRQLKILSWLPSFA